MILKNFKRLYSKKKLFKSISLSFLNKIILFFFKILSIPFLINSLGDIEYTIYITILSIIAFVGYFELGFTNASINNLNILHQHKKDNEFKEYVILNFISITLFILIFLVISLLVLLNFDFRNFLQLDKFNNSYLFLCFIFPLVISAINLPFFFLSRVIYVYEKGYIAETCELVGNLLMILFFIVAVNLSLPFFLFLIIMFSNSIISYLILALYILQKKIIIFKFYKLMIIFNFIKKNIRSAISFLLIKIPSSTLSSMFFLMTVHYHGASEIRDFGIFYQVLIALQIPISSFSQPLWISLNTLLINKKFNAFSILFYRLNFILFGYSFLTMFFFIFGINYCLLYFFSIEIFQPILFNGLFGLFGFLFIFGGILITTTIFSLNLNSKIIKVSFFQLFIFLLSGYFLIDKFLITGTLISIILSYIVILPISFYLIINKINLEKQIHLQRM